MNNTPSIQITPIAQSTIGSVDFDNLVFGRTFSDHMFMVDYEEGTWKNSVIVPFGSISISPAMMSLHYGQAIFEGMKAYKTADNEKIVVFRPQENWKRLNLSAERMCMPTIPENLFMEGLKALLSLDKAFIPQKEGFSMYIRPFMFSTDGYVGVAPSSQYKFIIFCCPVGNYYSKQLKVKIETKYIRAAKGGVGFSKNAGNYGGSLYPTELARREGYDQIIWTDASEHQYIEEAGTMNLLFVIDNVLVTAPVGDTILDGITRKSILTIARDWNMKVEERKLSVQELIEGIKNGIVQEAFGAGTAAVIASIATISYEGVDYHLPERPTDAFSLRVYKEIDDIKTGRIEDKRNWTIQF